MVRTSITDPLPIDDMPVGNGCLGITFCPGKKDDSAHGAAWNRDLDLDMDAIDNWEADAVLSLIEDHEFDMLRV
ncbi:MAG: ADP-ribosyl-(dinitrogen reductase) hydrolase, partial [Roseovarius sp.]|nr:ADP-ribosyl-(dinitrogen reductase) hydrolase [Roseovarius sp.]